MQKRFDLPGGMGVPHTMQVNMVASVRRCPKNEGIERGLVLGFGVLILDILSRRRGVGLAFGLELRLSISLDFFDCYGSGL